MASLIPIPTTRASDLLISQRLLDQLRGDQRDLLRIQSQLSTGRRIFSPSDDAPAAQRAILLQRLLEQKQQVGANREASQSYLANTEASLASVGSLLSDVRGVAVGISGNVAGDTERDAAIAQVRHALEQLVSFGNQKFRGRYLFGGASTTTTPFEFQDELIAYRGNEGHLQSFADVDLLVGTNLHGNEVFGAISPEVIGIADLNPDVTAATRLAHLRGGAGISDGSFTISDGTTTKTIDISKAETIEDVVRLIESNPPDGRTITASITTTGLQIAIDAGGGGNLTIQEVGGGTTAAELGILDADGNGTLPIVGGDLNPTLRPTTRLDEILGGTFDKTSGIQIVNGGETFTLDFQTAETVEDLLNIVNGSDANVLAQVSASGTGINIRSRLSGADFSIGENGGQTATQLGLRSFTGQIVLSSLNHGLGVNTASGADFTIHRRDGVDLAIDVSSAPTVQDVINLINNHADNLDPLTAVTARLAEFGNGIELIDGNALGTNSLAVTTNPNSQAAIDLGFVSRGQTQSAPAVTSGTTQSLQARDVNPLETKGAFNTLKRLIDAIEAGDQGQLERAIEMLDVDLNRVVFARGEIGARQQSLDVLGSRLEDEQIELQRVLSVEIDVDLVEAISEFTGRQASFQASLQTSAQTFRLTLLDFL